MPLLLATLVPTYFIIGLRCTIRSVRKQLERSTLAEMFNAKPIEVFNEDRRMNDYPEGVLLLRAGSPVGRVEAVPRTGTESSPASEVLNCVGFWLATLAR